VDRDLRIEMRSRDGESLGYAVFEDFNLAVGDTQILNNPLFDLDPPYDACVVIDPLDEVFEYYERNLILAHNPVCPDLPDLMIEEAYFATSRDNSFIVDVQNIGEGPVADRTLMIEIKNAAGRNLIDPIFVADMVIPAGRTERIVIPTGIAVDRLELAEGWSVSLNSDVLFVESDFENNSLHHDPGKQLNMKLYAVSAPERFRNSVEFHIDAYILQGRQRAEQVADLNVNQDIDWGNCIPDDYCTLHFYGSDKTSGWNLIVGGERLEVVISIQHPGTLTESYTLSEIFTEPDWEAGSINPATRSCSHWPMREDIGRHSHHWYRSGGSEWWLRYDLCQKAWDD
jgi:hypothetical protein